jgi:hypothetical protein
VYFADSLTIVNNVLSAAEVYGFDLEVGQKEYDLGQVGGIFSILMH